MKRSASSTQRRSRADRHPSARQITSRPANSPARNSSALPGCAVNSAISITILNLSFIGTYAAYTASPQPVQAGFASARHPGANLFAVLRPARVLRLRPILPEDVDERADGVRIADDDAKFAVLIQRGAGKVLRAGEGNRIIHNNQLGVHVRSSNIAHLHATCQQPRHVAIVAAAGG